MVRITGEFCVHHAQFPCSRWGYHDTAAHNKHPEKGCKHTQKRLNAGSPSPAMWHMQDVQELNMPWGSKPQTAIRHPTPSQEPHRTPRCTSFSQDQRIPPAHLHRRYDPGYSLLPFTHQRLRQHLQGVIVTGYIYGWGRGRQTDTHTHTPEPVSKVGG